MLLQGHERFFSMKQNLQCSYEWRTISFILLQLHKKSNYACTMGIPPICLHTVFGYILYSSSFLRISTQIV